MMKFVSHALATQRCVANLTVPQLHGRSELPGHEVKKFILTSGKGQ